MGEQLSTDGVVSYPAEPWDRSSDSKIAVVLFLLVWIVYLTTATYWVSQINDSRATAQSAWSLATRGTLALPEEWRGEVDWSVEGRDGQVFTNRFPGPTLWAAPFHAVGERVFPRPQPGHPHLLNYAPSGVAAATGAALGVVASYAVFRRLAHQRLAVAASLSLGLGTGMWSISADAMWPQAITPLFLLLGVLASATDRASGSGLAYAGAILTRPHLAVVPAVMGMWQGLRERRVRPVLLVGITSGLGLLAVVAYSRILFGTWQPIAGYGSYAVDNLASTPWSEYLSRVALTFADPVRGVLIYVPALFVLLPFVRHGWRESPWWVRSAAIAGALYMAVQLRANAHHGGAQFFGSRLTIETLVLMSPLLLRTWQSHVSRRTLLRRMTVALLIGGVIFHGLGATVWARPFFDRVDVWEAHLDAICEQPDVVGCPNEGVPGR